MRREDAWPGEMPLRLVQFTRSFHIGGTEVQVLELLRGLPSRYQLQVSVLHDAGPLMDTLRGLGHVPRTFPLHGSLMQANTLLQVGRMAAWLRQERVHLVHAHDFYSSMLAVPAAKLAGCRVVVGRLDLAHWHGPRRRALYAQVTRLADHVVANAGAIRRMLVEEEGIPAERVSVIHNGLDLSRFDARVRQGLTSPLPEVGSAPVVVHVANMNHPVKRQEDLLDALEMLKRKGRLLHAFLVGDGPRRGELERRAAEQGLGGQVHFLGHRRDVPAICARAALGVLCSTAEGMSNAVMEGMAAGLPMVVTRVGGNTDLVVDGERGLVVDPCQPTQLARAFEQLLDAPGRAREMGQAGRRFVERELSLERLVARHDALYRQLVPEERRRR